MRRRLVGMVASLFVAGVMRGQGVATDPDTIDLGLKEVTVVMPITHWGMMDGKVDAKITPYPEVMFDLDGAGHKVTLKGPPIQVKQVAEILRFLDRENVEVTTRRVKLSRASATVAARLINEICAPAEGEWPGSRQVVAIPAGDGKSLLVSGWKGKLDFAAGLLEKLDAERPASAPGESPKLWFRFVDTPLDDILTTMEKTFGTIILRPPIALSTKVTINVPDAVTEEQAIKCLNSLLTQLGYIGQECKTVEDSPRVVLYLRQSLYGRYRPPIQFGADASKVPTTDHLITQVIPLAHAKAADIKKTVKGIVSADADLTVNGESNSIVITDTAAKIHALLEKLPEIDR